MFPINRSLLSAKAFYFIIFAALASFAPFFTLYLESIGLIGRQIGIITGILPLITLFGAPFLGGVADATQQHKHLLILSVAMVSFMTLSLSQATSFYVLIIITGIYGLFFAPILPLVDRTVLTMLGERKDQYGKQRMWGAVSWGIAAPLVGVLLGYVPLNWIFYIGFILFLVLLVVSFYLPVKRVSLDNKFLQGVRLLATSRQWMIFLFVVFIGGAGLSIIHNYLFLHMNQLGASKLLMGFALTMAAIGEMTVMFYSDRLLRRWGTIGTLLLALVALVIRLLAYAYIELPWLILLVQLLHGPTFAALWVAGVARADELAPMGMEATAQGLFSGIFIGLGAAFGAFTGGVLYENVGSVLLFQWTAIGVLAGLVLFIVAERGAVKLKPAPTKPH